MTTSYAQRMLSHYIELIAKAAGVNWQDDNDAEIAGIVDDILEEPRTKIAALETRLAALEANFRELSDACDGAAEIAVGVHETQYHRS